MNSRNRRVKEGSPWRQPKDEECVVIPFPSRKAAWEHVEEVVEEVVECKASAGIPQDNAGAIALLESWLKLPFVDNSEAADEMRSRIDENRLSDHKFFS